MFVFFFFLMMLLNPSAISFRLGSSWISKSGQTKSHHHQRRQLLTLFSSSSSNSGDIMDNIDKGNENESKHEQMKRKALAMLDILTTPKDENSPEYDAEKNIKRDNVLAATDYGELKVELRRKKLRTSGDKLEMMTRILLNIIDPTIDFNELSGREPNVQFISKEDLESEKVWIIPEDERNLGGSGIDSDPDAEDLKVLRSEGYEMATSPNNVVGGGAIRRQKERNSKSEKPKMIMDGLVRREITFKPLNVQRQEIDARAEDTDVFIRSYVVGGRDVLKTWQRTSSVVVLLPDEKGWRSKDVRIFADEISFAMQGIVIVPDLFRNSQTDDDNNDDNSVIINEEWANSQPYKRIFDDVVATMQYCRNEFNASSITLAGIGFGGGKALEIASDFSDIASLGKVKFNSDFKKIDRRVNDFTEDQLGFVVPEEHQEEEEEEPTSQSVEDIMKSMTDNLAQMVADAEAEAKAEAESLTESEIDPELKKRKETEEETLEARKEREKQKMQEMKKEILVEKHKFEQSQEQLMSEERESIQRSIAAKRASDLNLFNKYSSLSLKDMIDIEPKAVFGICPSFYNIERVGTSITAATLLAYGGKDKHQGANINDAITIHKLMSERIDEILDFSVRIYRGRENKFLHNPKNDDDKKCNQEVILFGSIWLDAYSRDFEKDSTAGLGKTKLSIDESFSYINTADMPNKVKPSVLATYIHDDINFLKNERL